MSQQYQHYMREWRKKRGLSQQQLADALGTDSGMVSRYENNQRGLTLSMQFRIMAILAITPAQFFRHPDEPSLDELLQKADAEPERRKELIAMIIEKVLRRG